MQRLFLVKVKKDIITGHYRGFKRMIERVIELNESGWQLKDLIIKEVK